jgi:ABC-2 type transport system permease protein
LRKILRLTENETLKVLRKKRFLVVLFILIALIPLFAYGQYSQQQRVEAKAGTKDWRIEVQQQVTDTERRMQSASVTDEYKRVLSMQVEQNRYYLERNINPKETGAATFTRMFMQFGSQLFLPLLVIVIATDIVSTEHSDGTVKLLLTRPVKRWKILLSKYLTLLLFTTLIVMAMGAFSYLISGFFFGYQGWDAPMFTGFGMVNGAFDTSHVEMLPNWKLVMMNYGLGWIGAMVVATLSFMISVLIRATAAGMGVMMAVLIGGTILVQLANDFPLAKYLFVTHLTLTNYVNGTPLPLAGMTLGNSLLILGVWAIGGLAVAFATFTKRDVLA